MKKAIHLQALQEEDCFGGIHIQLMAIELIVCMSRNTYSTI
jgi:hypothetical protein